MSNNGFQLNGYKMESVADLNRLFGDVDAETMMLWGRPLSVEALTVLLQQVKTKVKSESVRSEIDARLRKLAQNTSIIPPIKTKSQKELEHAWQRRDAKLRSLGYDVESDNEEPTEEMRKVWRERERKMEMNER